MTDTNIITNILHVLSWTIPTFDTRKKIPFLMHTKKMLASVKVRACDDLHDRGDELSWFSFIYK